MAYCQNCGKQIDDKAVVCIQCGAATKNTNKLRDEKNIGFLALCFFFPMIGLVLYLVWKDDYPLKASSCGSGALIGFLVEVFAGIALGIISSAYAMFPFFSSLLSSLL